MAIMPVTPLRQRDAHQRFGSQAPHPAGARTTRGILAFDCVRGELDVLCPMKEIEQVADLSGRRLGQAHGHCLQQRPLMGVAVRGKLDVQVGPARQRGVQLVLELVRDGSLARLGHPREVDGLQEFAVFVPAGQRGHAALVPGAPERAVVRGRAGAEQRGIACLMSGRVRRFGGPSTRARMFTVLRHHHAVQRCLDRDGGIWNLVALAQRLLDLCASGLVPRRDETRHPVRRRLADYGDAYLLEKSHRFLFGHRCRCPREHPRHLGRVASLVDAQPKVERHRDGPATRLRVDATRQGNLPERRAVGALALPPISPRLAVDGHLRGHRVRPFEHLSHHRAPYGVKPLAQPALQLAAVKIVRGSLGYLPPKFVNHPQASLHVVRRRHDRRLLRSSASCATKNVIHVDVSSITIKLQPD
jgi:hypothetical protein